MNKYIKTFWNRRYLLYELVKKGVKLKYRRSYLGIIWSLLEPLLTTCVLTIVFGTLLGNHGKEFPMYILCGRLLYNFFSQSTKAAAKSIRANSQMIRKVYVPKYLYPLSCVLYNYIIFLISLLVLIALGIYCEIRPTWHIAEVIIPLLILPIFTYGVGMILATVTVFFRDMEYLWDVILMLVMYTCAIFYYPDALLESGYAWILKMNPLFCIIQSFRNAIFGNAINMQMVIYALVISLVLLLVGNLMFYKKQDEFILHV